MKSIIVNILDRWLEHRSNMSEEEKILRCFLDSLFFWNPLVFVIIFVLTK